MPPAAAVLRARRAMVPPGRLAAAAGFTLGRYNYPAASAPLAEHHHRDAIEICFLVKGRQTYEVGGEWFHLSGGDVFLTLPGERHSTGGQPEEKGILYWFTLMTRRRPVLDLPPAQARALVHALQELPSRLFRGSWRMKDQLDAIMTAFPEDAPREPARERLRDLAVTTAARAFLLEVVRAGSRAPRRAPVTTLAAIARQIEADIEAPLSVPELAARAGLSGSWFKARFKQEFGVPPAEFVLRAKVEEARRRLRRPGTSVTQVAFDLGFSSSQYFATVFRRFTGQRPSEAR